MLKRLFQLAVISLAFAGVWLTYDLLAPVQPPPGTTLVIRSGSSARQIAEALETAGVIRGVWAFLALHRMQGAPSLKAGEYLFEANDSALGVHDRLVRGDVLTHTVVIPEGYNLFDIALALERAGLCTRDEFMQVARNERALAAEVDPAALSLEGYLFPDTYHLSRMQSPREIAATMVRRFRREAEALGLVGRDDLRRIVILASIVEKESGVTDERALIAGVFTNRLRRGMGLEADPTVIYAALLAGRFDGVIRQSNLAFDSPYNTYRHPGLPPGPIANPGRAALIAAMNPAETEYLYFVADNQGGHRFSRTLDEHNRNVGEYRRGLAVRGRR